MLYTTQYFGCYHHPEGSEYCSFDVICDMSVSCFLPFGSPKNWWLIVHHHFTLLKNESLIWRNNEITCFFDHHKKTWTAAGHPVFLSISDGKESTTKAVQWQQDPGRLGEVVRQRDLSCAPAFQWSPAAGRLRGATGRLVLQLAMEDGHRNKRCIEQNGYIT